MSGTTERAFQAQVTQLAEIRGWAWFHVRPARVAGDEWRTATAGSLGPGWPDLTLVRARDRRLIFAELKGSPRTPTTDQQLAVLEYLAAAGQDVRLWISPADWPEIERDLT